MSSKRFLALALALMMVLSCVPVSARAEETQPSYVAQIGDTGYENLADALNAGTKGDTVTLLQDVKTDGGVFLVNEITLDLNGKTLEAKHLSAFQGSYITDSSNGTGLLKVARGYMALQKNNPAMPIWNGTGYIFTVHTRFQERKTETPETGSAKYIFLPQLNPVVHDALEAGLDSSDVELKVEISWTRTDGKKAAQTFAYGDDLVKTVLDSYDAETGRYGMAYTLLLKGVPQGMTLSYRVLFVSASGVEFHATKDNAFAGKPEGGQTGSSNVTTDNNNKVTENVTVSAGEQASAVVPEGTQLNANTSTVKLTVEEVKDSQSDIILNENEEQKSVDVHIEGVAADNTVPMLITLKAFAEPGLNEGNIKLYHVENGVTVEMTRVASVEAFTAHNQFWYDPVTGDVVLYMASFSEVTAVSDTTKAWEGNFDYSWYTNAVAAAAEGEPDYIIANADQLAAFGAIVGGMDGQTQDSFEGKTVKLISDINLGDKESENKENIIFYPIGYNSDDGKYEKTGVAVTTGFYTFEGTFDGNGHTISNFYQNTWEMKGDNNYYDAELQYYRDGMGLFGKVYGGTVKNLTVKNFSSDGEYTTTGVIAAYADCGATFENIAIFNCNPRVYNIGNGGIVGCVGWYNKTVSTEENPVSPVTFRNITVDNSNKISALWGSYDVACGGLVGQYYPTSGQESAGKPQNSGIHFENCHVSAVMDVYNDVCANYQYYAYRYTGMMIGSIRENVTDEATGNVYPKMDGITASGCTVNFGDWNDYYYCELVANSLASYTHDHQMSRLEQVASVDVENMKVTPLEGETTDIPTSGRVNYVVVKAKDGNGMWIHGDGHDYAECYHFVNGVQHKHNVADSDNPEPTETVDGVEGVLKEDKQLVYREFNQLFTGYGWGVTSKGLSDYEGVETMGITVGEQEESVKKFEAIIEEKASYTTETTVAIGDLFKAVDNLAYDIDVSNVQVFVSPVGNDSTAGGTYEANATDWTQGTLTFSGTGAATITITDYNFCTPTTINVTVEGHDVFTTVFENTDKYLYRVGNANTVKLSSLFKAENVPEDFVIDTVNVTVATLAGNAKRSDSAEELTWNSGTIQFSGTGVVAVTIDAAGAKPYTLKLEVVDGYNVTTYSELKNRNSVLLANITMSSGGTYYLSDATLYGNGFEFDVTAGKDGDTANGYLGGNYVVGLKNAILDNIQIIGEVYTSYGATAKAMYNYPTILTNGDSIIANSYVSNCSSPVRAQDGNLQIINSTLEGGIFANLDIRGGTVTLDNVITINQSNADGTSTSNDKGIVGLGIVFYECNLNAKLHVKTNEDGTPRLTQYNYMSEKVSFDDTTANQLRSAMFGTSHQELQYVDSNGIKWINPCILSITEGVNKDNIDTLEGYTGKDATIISYDGYVYTVVPTADSVTARPGAYASAAQYNILPEGEPDHKDERNYVAASAGSNEFCYYNEDTKQLEISFDAGQNKVYDPNILIMEKAGQTLKCTVKIDGEDYTDKTITFSKAGTHKMVFSYTDPYNFRLNSNGEVESFSVSYEQTVNISVSVVEETAKDAIFTFYGYDAESKTAATTITDVKTVTSNSGNIYIMPASTGNNVTSTTIDGITVNCPRVFVDFKDNSSDFNWLYPVFLGVKIEDYADGGTAENATTIVDPTSTSKPANLTILTTDKPSSGSGWSSGSGKSGSEGAIGSGTYKNLYGWTSGAIGSDKTADSIYGQFAYKDNKGTTYYYVIEFYRPNHTCPTTCFTGDTLITLADGTQKRIDEITFEDQVLTWDFQTGEYVARDIALIYNHGEENYRIANLEFSDGTMLRLIGDHGVFDYDLNQFVYIDVNNMQDYVGHRFVQYDPNGEYQIVTLERAFETEEVVEAYSITSALSMNAFASGLLTVAPPEDFYNWIPMGDTLRYDMEQFEADIAEYGLYDYEVFADYVTYEQFVAWNGAYLKIPVEKGLITFEYILELIELYKPGMKP